MIKVSVIILNWNRKNLTSRCLESIEKLLIKSYTLQVIVVDNASSDGSQKALRKKLKEIELKKRHISGKLIENPENYGFAKGNNIGISYALDSSADFVMVLNNDTEVEKGLIVNFIKTMNTHNKAGVLSPKIYFAKGYEFHKDRYEKNELGKVFWYAGGDIDWANVYGVNHGVDEVDCGQYEEDRETDFATGTCMFFRREALESTGFFNDKYFMYLEDVDLCMRFINFGWQVFYTPKAYLWHKVAQSSAIGSSLNDYFTTRNRLYFGIKYAPARSKLALARESIKFLFKGRKWQKIGVRDFYLGRLGKGSWKDI